MLTLYQCITENEIIDTSGFWIHQDCLEGETIKKDTFPEGDKRNPLNGKEITIDESNSKDVYKFVTVNGGGGVSRSEFLKRLSDIYQKVETPEQTVSINGVQKMLQDAMKNQSRVLMKELMKIGQRADISNGNYLPATYEQLNKDDFVIVLYEDTSKYGLISQNIVSIPESEVKNKILITENSPPPPPAASAASTTPQFDTHFTNP